MVKSLDLGNEKPLPDGRGLTREGLLDEGNRDIGVVDPAAPGHRAVGGLPHRPQDRIGAILGVSDDDEIHEWWRLRGGCPLTLLEYTL